MAKEHFTNAKGKIVAGYDQMQHMIEGTPIRDFGVGPWTQPHALDVPDPMDFAVPGSGNTNGNSAAEAQRINLANAAGLQSDRANMDQVAINMEVANNCFDEPEKGGLNYGPNNTGDY